MGERDLEEATGEAITLLVDEAQHGLVKPNVVVRQLQEKELNLYLFFYLRGLYKGEGIKEHSGENWERLLMESKYLLDDFADLAIRLFAMYDRTLLMDFLKSSTAYAFEKVRLPASFAADRIHANFSRPCKSVNGSDTTMSSSIYTQKQDR
jgi:hypothetical protein